jgi:hypothetical protein
MARHFTHLREGATIDNFLAGTSQGPAGGKPGRPGEPKSSLTKAEMEDLARPRVGSRRAASAPPAAPSGVVPASLDAPPGQK